MPKAVQITYGIPSWSAKIYRARRNYRCVNCDGIITSGTKYLRNVVRLGENVGVDPLRNRHLHLDCTAPWFQSEQPHCLKSVGKLPGRTPAHAVHDHSHNLIQPSISLHRPELGTLLWQTPQALGEKIVFSKKTALANNALAEMEASLQIVLTAIVQSAGNQRKAMRLNHLINEIAQTLLPLHTEKL